MQQTLTVSLLHRVFIGIRQVGGEPAFGIAGTCGAPVCGSDHASRVEVDPLLPGPVHGEEIPAGCGSRAQAVLKEGKDELVAVEDLIAVVKEPPLGAREVRGMAGEVFLPGEHQAGVAGSVNDFQPVAGCAKSLSIHQGILISLGLK